MERIRKGNEGKDRKGGWQKGKEGNEIKRTFTVST